MTTIQKPTHSFGTHAMRIIMLAPAADAPGPIGKHTGLLVAALTELGHRVIRLPWGSTASGRGLRRDVRERLSQMHAIAERTRQSQFDILVMKTAHDWRTLIRDIPTLLRYRRRFQCVVLQFHGSNPEKVLQAPHRFFALATRLLLRCVDGVLVLSTEEQRLWRSINKNVAVEVAANPYHRQAHTNRPHTSDVSQSPVILFTGRLRREKGPFDVITACSQLGDRAYDLRIAGSGPCEQSLAQHADRLGVRAVLLGHLTGDALWEQYVAADIFAFPTFWPEGFPTVITEALDAGLPIVTTPHRGAVDHLADGVNAFFVPPERPDLLAISLAALIDDPAARQAMSAANTALVEKFEPMAVANSYVLALSRLCSAS